VLLIITEQGSLICMFLQSTEKPSQSMCIVSTVAKWTKYLIKIDGKGVDYKEIANNVNARILSLDFSKDNRFIEIIGTQMIS
jgi:hypothetical protein